jgi:hypothetical protein
VTIFSTYSTSCTSFPANRRHFSTSGHSCRNIRHERGGAVELSTNFEARVNLSLLCSSLLVIAYFGEMAVAASWTAVAPH